MCVCPVNYWSLELFSLELATNWFNFALSMSELGKTEQIEDSNLGIGEALIVWSEKADRMSVKMNEYVSFVCE